ncbi:hypothetical protein AZE42_10510 [Rhizopogon vesiculosus]|uniref:Uncharacterized protein n=1 Tax=Rhizopogon vesiculosus TaxID=180088 RepID=A0A1J8QSS3_9AGAM|nr:hypothetical protein AZE42_10510 [Rhizopogon vesiculosus]
MHHAFNLLVQEILQNVIHCPIVSVYTASSILQNEQPDELAEKQRVEQIVHYLYDNCPTISGSDSPAMDSTFVDVHAYSGCSKGPKSMKFAWKHVYIQKCLVDAWMRTLAEQNLLQLAAGDRQRKMPHTSSKRNAYRIPHPRTPPSLD